MSVCPGCGVIAPVSRTDCTVCNRAFGSAAPTIEARFDGNYWACIIECDFSCRGCGMRSPLDSLDTLTGSGEVECRRCGLMQAFDVDQWEEALRFAQDVADCAGPPGRLGKAPVLEKNEFTSIGVSNTYAEKTLTGMVLDASGMKPRSLRVRVAPGVPLCERCSIPLDVQIDRDNWKTQATCSRCNDRAIYDTPEDSFDQNADISAVLADDHRCDREPAKVISNAGAIAIACPSCNAPLPPSDGPIVCGYCGTHARIPRGARGKMGSSTPKRWWILFDDASYLRLGVDPDADDDEPDSDDDDDEHDHDGDDRMARVRAAQAAEASARAQRTTPKPSNGPVLIGSIMAVVAVLAIGGVVFSLVHGRTNAPPPETEQPAAKSKKEKVATPDEPADEPATEAPLARDKFQDLQGCTCKSGKDTRKLAVRMTSSGGEGFALAWVLDSGGTFFPLKGSAPPAEVMGRGLAVGVACSGDVMAVVSQDHATGWSISGKKRLWAADLGADYGLATNPSKTSLNIQCATVPLVGTTLKVPLKGSASKTLNIMTGK